VLREAAAGGFVLLTNQKKLLPLEPKAGVRVAVIGPHAAQPTFQGASFAQVGQRQDLATPLDAIRETYGKLGEVSYEPGDTLAFRVPPLRDVAIFTARDATVPGMNVDYFIGEDSQPSVEEVRTAGNMIWNLRMPGMGRIEQSGRVRVTATIVPEETGEYAFYAGSSAAFDLRLDGNLVISQGPQPAVDDTAVAIRPPILVAGYPLEAGRPVSVELEVKFGPSRAHSLHFGCRPPVPADLMERAEAAAAAADVVVVFVGETQDTSVESADRTTTRLPGRQDELVERVCEANPNTVVVLNTAHAVDLPWADRPAGLLQVWFPGQEYASALGAVLAGGMEPGGRMPVTFARREADYPVFDLTPINHDLQYESRPWIGYRHFDAQKVQPRFAFGHGLGYADFDLEGVVLDPGDGVTRVRVTVRNRSDRSGKEVVQVYVRPPAVEATPSPLELKGFATVKLGPGEATETLVELDERAFSHWSIDEHAWRRDKGACEILVGLSSVDIRHHLRLEL
jgi:beta-glucosidase